MPGSLPIQVNGRVHQVAVEPDWKLLTVLRDYLHLTGAKYGCGEGECGACTVLVDGEAVRSCLTPVGECAGTSITTIEGLGTRDQLHPVQQAFSDETAMQCGFCTPGMILTTVALLARNQSPDDEDIRRALDHSICRCCTYPRIERAVHRAVDLSQTLPVPAGVSPDPGPAHATRTAKQSVPWDRLRVEDRDYFGATPNGLVVVLPPGMLPRDRPQLAGRFVANGGAWLHLGGDGTVTAYAGKVDVGQDNRTAIALLIAEELRIPLDAITVILGDTDVSPYDIGTFGSRSMPDAGEYLRAAAATARDVLIGLAADKLARTPEELVAANGRVTDRQSGESVSYGDLVEGVQQVEISSSDAPVTPRTSWQVAGRSTRRINGDLIVSGEKHFPTDLEISGMWHGAILRPPKYGAEPITVDTSKAATLSGVIVVYEHPFIGAVAADPFTARRALRSVQVDWSTPDHVDEANLVDFLRTHPEDGPAAANLDHQTGDVAAALADATTTIEATYATAYIAHAPLETRLAIAEWEHGRVTVWTGTQTPFRVRGEVAANLGIPEEAVQVIVPPTGGAFGGKHSGEVATEAARLARAAGRPVRVMWSREEEFRWGYFRPASLIDVRSGVDADGRLTAWQMTSYNNGPVGLIGPYEIPNQHILYQPTEWPLRQGSYRGVAAAASHFARESHMDEAAIAIGADPVAFRLRHIRDERLTHVLQVAADRAGWSLPKGTGTGLGIACGIEKGGYVATVADVHVADDGRLTVRRLVVVYDCGALVNPDNVLNQVEGGTVMGLGGALTEAVHFANGMVQNPRFSQYRVPRLRDVPPVEVVLVDRPDQPPFGAGETPIITVAPALANAIFAACGRRIRATPIAPDGRV